MDLFRIGLGPQTKHKETSLGGLAVGVVECYCMIVRAQRFVSAVAAAVLAATGLLGAAAGPPLTALPDCAGAPLVRPAQVMFACGDGNFSASKLRWTGWGEAFAAATGIGEVNDCTPNCAAGKFHRARIVLIASGMQTCPGGRKAYATVTYAWIDRSPATVRPEPTVSFPCNPPH